MDCDSTPDRRSRKRRDTRQRISDVATRLFIERGFDRVTVDEVAAAADVGRMTVFNHFPRKEDLFFDLDEAGRETLREAIRRRDSGVSPIETLRLLAHRLVAEGSPYIEFSQRGQAFIRTTEASATLKARARAIRDEIAEVVALALAESVGREPDDLHARLAATLLLATWSVGFLEAHRAIARQGEPEAARAVFLDLVDRGTLGVRAALAGTPYA